MTKSDEKQNATAIKVIMCIYYGSNLLPTTT